MVIELGAVLLLVILAGHRPLVADTTMSPRSRQPPQRPRSSAAQPSIGRNWARACSGVTSSLWTSRPCCWVSWTSSSSVPCAVQPHSHLTPYCMRPPPLEPDTRLRPLAHRWRGVGDASGLPGRRGVARGAAPGVGGRVAGRREQAPGGAGGGRARRPGGGLERAGLLPDQV